MPHILIILIVGAIAGWLAGALVNLENGSLLVDILIGIIGGYIGFRLFGAKLSITTSPLINEIITATAGAAILCLIIKLIRKRA